MIQRIQSIFLAFAGISTLGLLGVPFAMSETAITESALFSDSLYSITDQPVLMGFFGVSALLALIAIFLFKNRRLQMRLTIFSIISLVLAVILVVVIAYNESEVWGTTNIEEQFGIFLPLIALTMLFLAYRFINKDEKLVRSADRLR